MRILAFAFVASMVFVVGVAEIASGGNEGNGPPGDLAMIAGGMECFPNTLGANLRLSVGEMGGGIVGVPGGSFDVSGARTGSCAEAVAALAGQLPSPLCSEGPSAFGLEGFDFVCSGKARSVVAAVGELAKKVVSP